MSPHATLIVGLFLPAVAVGALCILESLAAAIRGSL